ncbi:MAG: hypothetical protein WA979_02780 [Pacificimonas sp.]
MTLNVGRAFVALAMAASMPVSAFACTCTSSLREVPTPEVTKILKEYPLIVRGEVRRLPLPAQCKGGVVGWLYGVFDGRAEIRFEVSDIHAIRGTAPETLIITEDRRAGPEGCATPATSACEVSIDIEPHALVLAPQDDGTYRMASTCTYHLITQAIGRPGLYGWKTAK